jgi:hypothetical protein
MQELLKCESLADYEPTAEGAKKFLADHESDDRIQKIVKKLRDELKASGSDKGVEPLITYLINVQRESQIVIENYKEYKPARLSASDLEGIPLTQKPKEDALKPLPFGRYRDSDSMIDSMSERMKSKLNMFENIIFQKSQSTLNSGLAFPQNLMQQSPLQYNPSYIPPFTNPQSERDLDYLAGNLEIERDLQLVNFATSFYTKYSLVYFGESEKEKAAKLKIRVKLTNGKYVYLTRNELDDHSTKYRSIYSSYCALKRFVDRKETSMFEDYYSINTYFAFRVDNEDKLNIEAAPFRVQWFDPNTSKSKPDDIGTQYLRTKIFDTITVSMLKDHFDKDLGEDIILTFLCRKHYYFIEFMLRILAAKRAAQPAEQTVKKNTPPTGSSGAGTGGDSLIK